MANRKDAVMISVSLLFVAACAMVVLAVISDSIEEDHYPTKLLAQDESVWYDPDILSKRDQYIMDRIAAMTYAFDTYGQPGNHGSPPTFDKAQNPKVALSDMMTIYRALASTDMDMRREFQQANQQPANEPKQQLFMPPFNQAEIAQEGQEEKMLTHEANKATRNRLHAYIAAWDNYEQKKGKPSDAPPTFMRGPQDETLVEVDAPLTVHEVRATLRKLRFY